MADKAPPISRHRLSDAHLARLDALAAHIPSAKHTPAGSRTPALREAIDLVWTLLGEAGAVNAEEFDERDWTRLAQTNDPPDDGQGPGLTDWPARLAASLAGMWEGQTLVLPVHQQEDRACRKLAMRVSRIGRVRGYALYCALRHLWNTPQAPAPVGWWRPEVWMS